MSLPRVKRCEPGGSMSSKQSSGKGPRPRNLQQTTLRPPRVTCERNQGISVEKDLYLTNEGQKKPKSKASHTLQKSLSLPMHGHTQFTTRRPRPAHAARTRRQHAKLSLTKQHGSSRRGAPFADRGEGVSHVSTDGFSAGTGKHFSERRGTMYAHTSREQAGREDCGETGRDRDRTG